MNQLIRLSQRMAVGLACAVFLCGCPVTVDSSRNATPPTITWIVTDNGTNQPLPGSPFPANYTIQNYGFTSGVYFVIMHATTHSGPKAASVGGGSSWTCYTHGGPDGEVAATSDADYATKSASETPDASNQVDEDMYVVWGLVHPFSGMDCQSGYSFGGGGIFLYGSAQNFANVSTNGTLSFWRP